MSRVTTSTCAIFAVGGMVAGCQSAPVQYASTGVHATYQVAETSAGAVRATGGELYTGAGAALRAPLHDFNVMQDKIPPVLLRAEDHPYDLVGVNTCNDVLDRVAELDLALGPDVDTPKAAKRTRVARGADFAASTALDAAGSAAEHFIPMRGTIKQLTGAQRYENHAKHAALAGTTRRSFLKAIGMEHSCIWPAAPLDFQPVRVANASAPWSLTPATSPAQTSGAPILLASIKRSASAKAVGVDGDSSPRRLATAHASQALEPVSVPIYNRLSIPTAASPAADASQSWRQPAASFPSTPAGVMEVSAPITDVAASTNSAAAPPPWSAAFASSSPHR